MGSFCENVTYLQSAATLLTSNSQFMANQDFQKKYYASLELKGLRICQLLVEVGGKSDIMGLRLRMRVARA